MKDFENINNMSGEGEGNNNEKNNKIETIKEDTGTQSVHTPEEVGSEGGNDEKSKAETSSVNNGGEEVEAKIEWKDGEKGKKGGGGSKSKKSFFNNEKENQGEKEKDNYEMPEEFWGVLGTEAREKVVDYKKENNLLLSEERKKSILNILEKEKGYKFQDLAQEWAEEHKDELKEKGLEGGDPVKLFSQAMEEKYGSDGSDWGSFLKNASKGEGDYGDKVREYINIFAVSKGFEKNPDNPDNQYGALYYLQKRSEKLEEKTRKTTEKEEKKEIKSQLDELYEDQSGLIKGIKGLDILKDTEKNLPKDFTFKPKPGGESESIINKKLSDFEKESEGKPLKENFYNLVDKLGYNLVEKRGFRSLITGHRLEIIDDKGEKLTWPGSKEIIGGFSKGVYRLLLDRYKEKLTREQGVKYMYRERIKGEARKMVESADGAEEGVESLYNKIKNKLVLNFVKKNVVDRNKFKSPTEKRKLRERFESKGKSDVAFVEKGKEIKSKLTGEWQDDSPKIISYLNEYAGTDLDDNFLKDRPEIGNNYKKLFKKGKIGITDFLGFVLKVAFSDYEQGLR